MERPPIQCPFIERVDHRCSSSFSLERLDHAFDVCFDQYRACPLFQQMMAERRMKRHGAAGESVQRIPASDKGAPPPPPALWAASQEPHAAHAASRFVQVRVAATSRLIAIADAYAQHAS